MPLEGASPRPWYVEGNSILTSAATDDPYVVEEVAELASDARLPTDADARLIVSAVNEYEALRAALAQAIEVIEWCGANDKTPTYGYGHKKDAQRRDGELPGPGKAFNTPREFAAWWPERLRAVLNGEPLDV